jgi:hypothetical protein
VKDPYPAVLSALRADSAVVAIATQAKVSSTVQAPPCVRLIDNSSTRNPFGQGSGRLGLQLWIGFARCYGTDDPAGAILARQLASAVSDALHGRIFPGSTFVFRAYAPDIEGLDRDPDTKWPYYDVRVEAYTAAFATA